ncbi:hypothetical protein ACS0TY_018516 [Phlomoides rotata]
MVQHWGTGGALGLTGIWLADNVTIHLVNICAYCDPKEQKALWEEVKGWKKSKPLDLWCVCGDFNSTLHTNERKGRGRYNNNIGIRKFREFVKASELSDLPLLRRKFTWYKDNGECCSHIDRFLLTSGWCNRWPNAKQVGLKKSFSDHAPIFLENCQPEFWGPIPFKMVNWWLDRDDFRILFSKFWKDSVVEGWGCFVLKEKLKLLKKEIKIWKSNNGTSFSKEIEEAEQKLVSLDEKVEAMGWNDEDR